MTMTTPDTNPVTRNRRWSWLLALPLAGALAFPAATALARPEAGAHAGALGHFDGRRMGKLLEAAGASDAQRAQIKTAWANLRPQLQAVREQRGKLQADLRKALSAPTIDTAAVERLRQQGVQLADKASALFTQGMVQTAQVLTPEQRQKVAAQLEQNQGHWRHARGE
jgi:protein CpxP